MAPTAAEAIDTTRTRLARYQRALGPGPESDEAINAAWYLHRAVQDLLPAVDALLAERDDLAARLEMARRDPVTHLPTRAAWTASAEQLLADTPASVVLLIDLVDFKGVNDAYGHEAGDVLLEATGARLADWAGPDGHAGRLGGDEFAVALPDHHDLDDRVAKLRDALARPVDYRGRPLAVEASIGAAPADPSTSLSAALRAADLAMYADKGRGRRGRRRPSGRTPQPAHFLAA